MGGRLMRRWLSLPLKNKEQIEARYEVVQFFTENRDLIAKFQEAVRQVGDLERLISKVSLSRVSWTGSPPSAGRIHSSVSPVMSLI